MTELTLRFWINTTREKKRMAEKKTFEQSISELEEIVAELENGDVTLDESLSLFEKGIKLSKGCQKMLDEAEKKVSVLMTDDKGEITKEDFPDLED